MKKSLLFLSLLFAFYNATAQSADVKDYGEIEVLSNADYCELYHTLQADNAQDAYDKFIGEFVDVDLTNLSSDNTSQDELYSSRLKMMATEIQLPYNDVVRRYINIYTRKGGTMEHVLGIGRYYFPIFEEILYDYNIPLEMKMLPVIESALIPVAKSHASAVGLWQMMMRTAKYYGLEINSFVDERRDPVKSTHAACRYLKDLYKMYGDWTLVIAAYNCGPGNVNKAVRRAGAMGSYWDIWEYLPRETRGHVPAFIGASYGYTFHKAHSLTPREATQTLVIDTMRISRMLHFDQISSTIPITTEELRTLNPKYRIDIIPAIERPYTLVLPINLIGQFIDNEKLIYSKEATYLKKYLEIENLSPKSARAVASKSTPTYTKGKKMTYKIKSGDTLGGIAERYNVKASDIRTWNPSIQGSNIRAGKSLVLYPR